MNKPKLNEREYVEKIARLMREGLIHRAFRKGFNIGVVCGLVVLLISAMSFVTYLHVRGYEDDWRFHMGLIIGISLSIAIFMLSISLASIVKDISSRQTRPFTLMVKYHDHLVRAGLDPYEDTKT